MLAQLQVINLVLSTKDYSFIIDNNINSDYFTTLKPEFNFIDNHYQKYHQVPDIATFLHTFPDFEVITVTESTDYLLQGLYREKREAFLVSTFGEIKDLMMADKIDEAMDLYISSSLKAPETKPMAAIEILSDVSRYNSYLDKCQNFGKYYISTGFKELDDSLGGGIDRQNAYFVISARAGIGKTLVMVKFAAAAVDAGLRVGFYEGEMTVDKIAGRYDTLVSHISNGAINHGNEKVANDYKKFLDNLSASKKGKFYILTRDMVSDDKMTVDVLRNFVEKYSLDILFVDQLSLLDSTSKARQTYEQAADISKALKNLQVTKHIPIVVASQQNRNALESNDLAGTRNLSLSDRIGQDATEVIFLTKENIDEDKDRLKINIAKARDGAKVYVLDYDVDFNTGNFSFCPPANNNSKSDGPSVVTNSNINEQESEPF